MGSVKDYELEKASECAFDCPLCGDVIPVSREEYDFLTEQGCCNYCAHVLDKDD